MGCGSTVHTKDDNDDNDDTSILLNGKEITMDLKQVKRILYRNNLPIWKLIRAMGISRNCFYDQSHVDYKGNEKQLIHGFKKLGVKLNESK